MSRGVKKWSEDDILKLQHAGRGQGRLASYIPWLDSDFYSQCRTHKVWGRKTGRAHQLLSDGEHAAFLLLQRDPKVVDIREQYPLDRDLTRKIAKGLGIRHPVYPGTHVPLVMTLDFLVTKKVNGREEFEALSIKACEDLKSSTTVARLEIERCSCEALGIPFRVLVKEQLPVQKAC
ncbi:TnsA endonuclease N-terminal domain-containing protein [Roseateles sp.]|uniref:TnsA endonuclease N-terminal domain-containing protein n=1 Tax=Roseateles sp. TaxID=1971397 RepID=UPI0039EAA93E